VSLNPCMGCEGDFAGIVDAICDHCRVELVDALTHDMEPEIPLSTRDPLVFLAVLGGQLAAAVIAVEVGTEAPGGWKRDVWTAGHRRSIGYINDAHERRVWRDEERGLWGYILQNIRGEFTPYLLEAIWHATDPGWIDRAKVESAAWTGNGGRS
jgi:hypothetical protein